MSFVWRTSFVGYPNFFVDAGASGELADVFIKFADAAERGVSYSDAKSLIGVSSHQAETKKAAFQEYGLLYVLPGSDKLAVTPLGKQVRALAKQGFDRDSRRLLLVALARGLARYQFTNPMPVGGRAALALDPIDLRPYLAAYYLLHELDGVLTKSELRGCVFGVQSMAELAGVAERIRGRRASGQPFPDLDGLPSDPRTRENLRIYFTSHLGLDSQILQANHHPALYGGEDPAYELTGLGWATIAAVLDIEWPGWRLPETAPPRAEEYADTVTYFSSGVGAPYPAALGELELAYEESEASEATDGLVSAEDLEEVAELPRKQYVEARHRLSNHKRLEKSRNPALVRDAKAAFLRSNGSLWCEVCGFDFGAHYGERGNGYIHAHHIRPVAEIEPDTVLTIDDLAMVCANCHAMLHRAPWISVGQLRGEMSQATADSASVDDR